eukprot:gnl/TRDRNA2_/TRDRNA2_201081_c0_seq1.p1 gnl/TRDRNA2_/TRDRNA2_201081_c0~~gnl/TRDRNA2_/TRDRNA2_201081_c0_seq1.p1  ORF type:complete len:344 (-),score=43.46 gnl/TRDRNA2_/TRDRNA2_201081_c0_seq1:146-1138(-)
MVDECLALAEPLVQDAVPCDYSCRFRLSLLFLLIATDLAVSLSSRIHARNSPATMGRKLSEPVGVGVDVSLSDFMPTGPGVQMPRIMFAVPYHAAENQDAGALVASAVNAGLRGLQIAGHPGNFYQQGVDAGLKNVLESGVPRSSLFIQVGINPKLTFDFHPEVPLRKHVQQMVANALSNLGLDYLDVLVLQATFPEHERTMELWEEMEALVEAGFVRHLGIRSLKSLSALRRVYSDARLKPVFLQLIVHANSTAEQEVQKWCDEMQISLEKSWTLTADRQIMQGGYWVKENDDYNRKSGLGLDKLQILCHVLPDLVPGKCEPVVGMPSS